MFSVFFFSRNTIYSVINAMMKIPCSLRIESFKSSLETFVILGIWSIELRYFVTHIYRKYRYITKAYHKHRPNTLLSCFNANFSTCKQLWLTGLEQKKTYCTHTSFEMPVWALRSMAEWDGITAGFEDCQPRRQC